MEVHRGVLFEQVNGQNVLRIALHQLDLLLRQHREIINVQSGVEAIGTLEIGDSRGNRDARSRQSGNLFAFVRLDMIRCSRQIPRTAAMVSSFMAAAVCMCSAMRADM